MFLRSVGAVVLTICLLAPVAGAQEGPDSLAGIVVYVEGDVVLERDGEYQPVAEGFVLKEGDIIVAKTDAACTGFTPLGEAFELAGPSELHLPTLSEGGMLDRVSGWVRGQLAQWVGESRRRPLVSRAAQRDWEVETDAPGQLIPAPNGKVRPGKAVFLWATVPGIDSYLVTFASESGDEFSRLVRDRYVVLNDLVPGEEYAWKVEPSVEGWAGQPKWRTFRVLEPEEVGQLDSALEGMADLEAGVLLLSAGLHEEAIYRLDAAVSSSAQAVSARRWRAKAMAEIGLYREAYQDLIQTWGEE